MFQGGQANYACATAKLKYMLTLNYLWIKGEISAHDNAAFPYSEAFLMLLENDLFL